MQFAELVAAYERLEATSKRLEARQILVDLLKRIERDELRSAVYLMQGQLRPEFEGVELGVADSLARKAVSTVTAALERKIAEGLRRTGDLGTTVAELLEERPRRLTSGRLEVREVYDQFLQIAKASGEGSQQTKVRILVELLSRSSPTEAKYVVRFVLGKLRLGVREMTLLDAFAQAFADGSKEARSRIEAAFNVSSDLGLVADRLARGGVSDLDQVGLEVGRPVRPMLAEREPSLRDVLERMEGRAALEYKYDGLRVQAHVPERGPVRLFSRRLEEISAQFPELVAELPAAIRRKPAIVEGECVPIDPNTEELRPFQEVSRRRGRKYDLDRLQEEVPVHLFLFDVLLDGGTPDLDRPFPERRMALESLVHATGRIRLAVQRVVHSESEAEQFFLEAIAAGSEGVMAKSVAPGSVYRAGARGFWWIKYKRDYTHALADSVDGVVVGAFYGRGRRGGAYGALLCAVYNPHTDRFETFCKVGSGFDDATLTALPKMLKPHEVDAQPESVDTGFSADVWFRPAVVLEIRGAELTLSPVHRAAFGQLRPDAGLALRFPRFTGRFRTDKGPEEATTSAELISLYRAQVKRASPGSTEELPAK